MNIDEKISVVEAVLFSSGDPIEAKRLCESADVDEETLKRLIVLLNERYNNTESALKVVTLGTAFQLVTREEFASYIKTAMEHKNNMRLSPAAFEVLTVIAYNQPVTKGFVEHVRGVDSSSVVNSLVEKGLLEEAGRIDVPGRPIAYRTTQNFLRCFGLASLEELPSLPNTEQQITLDDVIQNEDSSSD